jgi:hypothetical protein
MKWFCSTRYWRLALGALAWLCQSACGPVTENQELVGPCTETGNPTGIQGKILSTTGNPAKGTVVKLLQRIGPDSSGIVAVVSQTTTCSDGTFGFAKLAAANYALEAFDSASGKIAWFPQAEILDSATRVHVSLTLESPGMLTGTVTRGPNLRPAGILNNEKIVVRLMHTNKSFTTDTSGNFQLGALASGLYRVVFTALDGHYLAAYVDSVRVNAGATTVLPRVDLIWSPFVTPPVPAVPSVDSVSNGGAIRIHWNPVFVSNLSHYEMQRTDTLDFTLTDTLSFFDTVFVDAFSPFAAGHAIKYRIRTVNKLGSKSDWSGVTSSLVPEDSVLPGEVSLGINVKTAGMNAKAVKVRLFRIPKNPDPPGSLPAAVKEVALGLTGLDGLVQFSKLAPDSYGIEAVDSLSHTMAYRIVKADGNMNVVLDLKPIGTVKGTVSRQKLWVASPFKGDENIQASLMHTPYFVYSNYGFPHGEFKISGVPAGTYNLIVFAPPEGYFLADTLKSITVIAGDTTTVPLVTARYNPAAPPPKIASLQILPSSGIKAYLKWDAIPNYPFLQSYEVLRMDASLRVVATSGPIKTTSWDDDLLGVRLGSTVYYVIRIITTRGVVGANGGDAMGNPVSFQVPN